MRENKSAAQGQGFPLKLALVTGLSLYFACFFTMLMRNSFMDGDIDQLWYHLFLRVVFLAGAVVLLFAASRCSDRFSGEKGNRGLRLGACLFSVVAAVSSFTSYSFELTMPLVFDLFAWGLAGAGLACLFLLWAELLSAFEGAVYASCAVSSVACGAVLYLAMNLLPFPYNIGALCLCPLVSLGINLGIERDEATVPAAFVPRVESRTRARLAPSFKLLSAAYGVVFGLGIGSTTQLASSAGLYTGVAGMLALGAVAAKLCLERFPDQIAQGGGVRLLFPVLIIALAPMSFLQGDVYFACNLLLLACYTLFDVIGLKLGLDLAARRGASSLNLIATSQGCLLAGLMAGHVIGLAATSSGVMDYKTLSFAALALVVMLAIFVTFASVVPLSGERPHKEHEEQLGEEAEQGPGRWKRRVTAAARDYGLSARETEVFFFLAKGRGIEHIQNKLVISSHTVKTHIHNIYRKMGVNSREELLDLIEDYRPADSSESSCPETHRDSQSGSQALQ